MSRRRVISDFSSVLPTSQVVLLRYRTQKKCSIAFMTELVVTSQVRALQRDKAPAHARIRVMLLNILAFFADFCDFTVISKKITTLCNTG